MQNRIISRLELGIAIFFAIASLAVLVFLIVSTYPYFGQISDLPEYYAPARFISEGRGELSYDLSAMLEMQNQLFPSLEGRMIALYLPPPGLVLLSPMAMIAESQIAILWKLLISSSLLASLLIISSFLKLGLKQTSYVIAGTCLSQAAFELLRIDQIAGFLLLAYCASLSFIIRQKWHHTGLFLALLLALKPQQALPYLAFLLGNKRWKILPSLLITLSVLCAIAFWQIGWQGFENYFSLLADPSSPARQQPELTPTIRGQLLRLIPGQEKYIFGLTTILYGISLLASFAWGWKLKDSPQWLWTGIAVLMPVALVFSLHCHIYDLLLMIPSIVLLFQDKGIITSSITKLIIMFGGLVFMMPAALMIHYNYLLPGGVINPMFLAMICLAVILVNAGLNNSPSGDST